MTGFSEGLETATAVSLYEITEYGAPLRWSEACSYVWRISCTQGVGATRPLRESMVSINEQTTRPGESGNLNHQADLICAEDIELNILVLDIASSLTKTRAADSQEEGGTRMMLALLEKEFLEDQAVHNLSVEQSCSSGRISYRSNCSQRSSVSMAIMFRTISTRTNLENDAPADNENH